MASSNFTAASGVDLGNYNLPTTVTGTGSITLAGAATGFRTFNAAIGVGPETYYCIVGATGEWEIGEGYLSSSTTLVRDTVYTSSNANALVFSSPIESR